jgi:O-antigen/teichoic acid export membrane protein
MIAVLALYAERLGGGPFIAFCIVCWWLSYGIVYFSSQGLVAVRREELGSFFFYSSINLATFAALAMYLLVAPRPELAGAIATATFAALVAASISLYALARLAPAGRSGLRVPLKEASQVGASIVAARVLQGLLFWIPVWTVAHAFSPARAAVFAIASRLLFGVMGALAAVRFSVRPAIVAAIALDRWPDIERDGRRIAIVACAAVILAILATLAVGEPILGAFFGEQYRPAAMILVVLLLGGLGESIGGPVDEVIKMSGGQSIALVAIGVVVAVEFCLALIGARGGLLWVAAAQAAAFWLLYGFYVFYLQSRCGVLLLPVIRRQVSSAATQRSKAEIRT